MEQLTVQLHKSIQGVGTWVEKQDYKGNEPFDGLSSFVRPLTFGNLLLDRILMQLIRQSPLNLRPVLGVKPLESTIGRGYMASGYLTMLRITGDAEYRQKAAACLDWLLENKSPFYPDYSWGKHFDFASRGGRYPKFEPITIWTSLIGLAFLEAYELLHEKKYLEVVSSACDWVMKLPRTITDSGICINYTALQDGTCTIHNQSMMAAAMLAGTARHTGNKECRELAQAAMEFSCNRQLPNGGWYYGEDPKYHWIDNFHTGYNLESLRLYTEFTDEMKYSENLRRGFNFYKTHFFEESGRPKYYHNRTFPVDSQCAAQAIETLADFSEYDASALTLAVRVAQWTVGNMQDSRGFFYYRQYPLMKAKTPMLHWAQAVTYKALTILLLKLTNKRETMPGQETRRND